MMVPHRISEHIYINIDMLIERLKNISMYFLNYHSPICHLISVLFINTIVYTASVQRAREEATHSCIQHIYCLGPLSISALAHTGKDLVTHYYEYI